MRIWNERTLKGKVKLIVFFVPTGLLVLIEALSRLIKDLSTSLLNYIQNEQFGPNKGNFKNEDGWEELKDKVIL